MISSPALLPLRKNEIRLLPAAFLFAMTVWATTLAGADADAGAEAEAAADEAALLEDEKREQAENAMPTVDPAAEPYWQALKLFQGTSRTDWARGRELLQESADLEFTHAQNYLGLCLLGGNFDFAKDPRKAANLFRLAAERGNAFAMLNLGLCYLNGTGLKRERAKAVQWLLSATAEGADYSSPPPPADFHTPAAGSDNADTGTLSGALPVDPADQSRALAHFNLAELYAQDGEAAKAQDHYVKAALMGPAGRAGIYQAALKAATGFAFGQGVARNLAKANEMLEQSRKLSRRLSIAYAHSLVQQKLFDDFAQADLEESFSAESEKWQRKVQFDIAGSFADPKSKNYDAREAVRWYEIAAEGGEPEVMVSLAFLYLGGKLGAADPVKAFEWFKRAAETDKHLLGRTNLAICYQHGLGTPADPEKAAAIFKEHRDQSFVCYLGTIGEAPKAPVTADQELELTTEWAKRNKDPHAQYFLGLRYLYGWSVKAKVSTALDWLEKAGKASHPAALCQLGVVYHEPSPEWLTQKPFINMTWEERFFRVQRAAEYYRRAMEAGDVEATANLAAIYQNGAPRVPQDLDKAASLLEKCLEMQPSHGRSQNNLGVLYETRYVTAKRAGRNLVAEVYKSKLLNHFQEAHRLGFSLASRNLGRLYYDGVLAKQDYEQAYLYFQAATEQGDAVAHRMLGQMHENGQGVPVTLREAAYHYRLGALAGDELALIRICNFYLQGKGVSRDYDRAAFWLTQLAQRGDARGVTTLGNVLLDKKDYTQALTFFRNLAKSPRLELAGYANERLARMYENGWGVKTSASKGKGYRARAVRAHDPDAMYTHATGLFRQGKKKEAVPLLYKAARNGKVEAIYTLGCLHMTGDGVLEDSKKGWEYLLLAARGGSLQAQYTLAAGTLDGKPGAPGLDEGLQWAKTAEAAGFSLAKAVREQLEQRHKAREGAAPAVATN